ncbi:Ff.00g050110.m01.CDS01 [Fusarium sp. VM40]|nr:Ff.00g050110.m01.CDS01 [Fusarium sp. VM40]
MARGKRYRKEYNDPDGQGFCIRIWDISSSASKSDIEDLLREHGFSAEVHWPETEVEGPYEGWCRVDFESGDEANNARSCLNRKFVQGVSIRTGPVCPISKRARIQHVRIPRAPRRTKKKVKRSQPVVSEQAYIALPPSSLGVASISVPTIMRSPEPLMDTGKSPDSAFAPLPNTWEHSENDTKQYHEDFMTAMASAEAKYYNIGVINRPMVMTLPDGRQTLRPLVASNHPTGELFTYVQKIDGGKEFEKVPLAQLALCERLG